MVGYLKAWIKFKRTNTRDKLVDLIAHQQFFEGCPKQLRTAVWEKSPGSVGAAPELADLYVS